MMEARGVAAALAIVGALASPSVAAAPAVWAIDDGEKIKRDETASPLASGAGNPIWTPGQPIRIFSTKNESVAFQIVVTADEAALDGVTVELDVLATADGAKIQNAPGAIDPTSYVGRPIERFVEHFVEIKRVSGGKIPGESLDWTKGSGPPAERWLGMVPDALVPVEVAPAWAPYPMKIAPRSNGIVWIDVTVPKTQVAGLYKGAVVVKAGATTIASLAVELDVVDVTLPDRPVRTMVYYDRLELDRRMRGGDAAEEQLWRLFHRHRLSPLHGAISTDDVTHRLGALDGSFYTAAHGYEGPAEAMGDGVLALGTYGVFRAPDASKLAIVEGIADLVAEKSLFATTDAFVYAIDEVCESPYGDEWKKLIASSRNANVKRIRVGATCSEDPTARSIDLPIVADTFDPSTVAAARAMGREVWVYNGREPFAGAFSIDVPAISPRVNGWLAGMYDVARWFQWEATFWYDDNRGGKGPCDPFVTAETFHNQDDDYVMGGGVLVYPGKQVDVFAEHSIGMVGVVASIRMKGWRRGIEDAGYYQLAHAANAAKAEAIAMALVPRAFSAATAGDRPAWSDGGKAFFDARKALLDLVPRGTNGGEGIGAKPSFGVVSPAAMTNGDGRSATHKHPSARRVKLGAAIAVALAIGIWLVFRRRREAKR